MLDIRTQLISMILILRTQFLCKSSSVQSLSSVWLFVIPWTAARQASLSITNSWSLLKLISIESAIQSSHPLSSPYATAFNLSQHQSPFQWVCSSIKYYLADFLHFKKYTHVIFPLINSVSSEQISCWIFRRLSNKCLLFLCSIPVSKIWK